MRLLLVEDSDLVRRMYGLAFFRHKHELVEAENGRRALELLDASTIAFDLILLDLNMPDMNGVEFIKAVQRGPLFRIPIVVVTAETETSLLREARTLGVAAIVKKPWKLQELGNLVQSVLETWHP